MCADSTLLTCPLYPQASVRPMQETFSCTLPLLNSQETVTYTFDAVTDPWAALPRGKVAGGAMHTLKRVNGCDVFGYLPYRRKPRTSHEAHANSSDSSPNGTESVATFGMP